MRMTWRPLRPAGSNPPSTTSAPRTQSRHRSISAGRFRLVPQARSRPGHPRARIGEGNQIAVLAHTRREPSERKTGRPIELCKDAFSDRCATATHGGHDRKRPPGVSARCRQARLAHNARPGLQHIPTGRCGGLACDARDQAQPDGSGPGPRRYRPQRPTPEKRGHGPTPTQTAAAGDLDPDLSGAGRQRPMGTSSARAPLIGGLLGRLQPGRAA